MGPLFSLGAVPQVADPPWPVAFSGLLAEKDGGVRGWAPPGSCLWCISYTPPPVKWWFWNALQLLEGWSTVLLALLFVFSVYTPPPTSYPSQLGSKLCLEREGRRGPTGPQLHVSFQSCSEQNGSSCGWPWSPCLLPASPFLNPSSALGDLGLRCSDECQLLKVMG